MPATAPRPRFATTPMTWIAVSTQGAQVIFAGKYMYEKFKKKFPNFA